MLTLFVALLAAAPSAHADEALRTRCLDLLSAYETPATEADWRALGNGVDAELLAIAKDASLSHTRRANAIVALGYFPADTTRAYLAGLATGESNDGIFRRKAVYALATGYGEGALPELTAALGASDIHLRAAAARALGTVGTAAAKEALKARLAVEGDRMVKETLSATLAGK